MNETALSGVSAVVVTYKTGPRLKDCLHALTSDPEIDEVIIVDNGNPPDTTEWLKTFSTRQTNIRYIPTGKNLGFGAGVNLGAKAANGETLLVINPDCVLKRGAVSAFQHAVSEGKRPTLIGGRIFQPDGREARGGRRRRLTLWRAMLTFMGFDPLNLDQQAQPDQPTAMGAITGALFFTPAEDFQRLGGFDERYFLHFEDLDLCERVHKAGGEVIYQPHAAGLHYGATSDVSRHFINRHKADSLILYLKTHARNRFEALMARCLAPLIRAIMRANL